MPTQVLARTLLVIGVSLHVGCGGQDPILDRAAELGSSAAPSGASASAPASRSVATPAAGGAPPDGGAAAPADAAGVVLLTGSIDVDGWKGGAIRVDVFDGDQQGAASGSGRRPSVVAVARLTGPGPFEIKVPGSVGNVWLGAFADEDGDGRPGPSDPSGWYSANPVSTAGDQDGLKLLLTGRPPPPAGGMD